MKKAIATTLLLCLTVSFALTLTSCVAGVSTYTFGTVEEIGGSYLILSSTSSSAKYQVNLSPSGTKVFEDGVEATIEDIQVGDYISVGFNGAVKIGANKQIDALTITISN